MGVLCLDVVRGMWSGAYAARMYACTPDTRRMGLGVHARTCGCAHIAYVGDQAEEDEVNRAQRTRKKLVRTYSPREA